MGTNIRAGSTFLGVPLVKARNVLKAWRYGESKDAHRIAIRKDVELDVPTVMALLDEFQDRGLIGDEEDGEGSRERTFLGLTRAGMALVAAHARKRVPKARAWKAVDELLASSQAANDRADLPFVVDEVWLFGSILDDARPDVGDVDYVIEVSSRDGFDYDRAEARYAELGIETYDMLGPSRAVRRRILYGPRRNPLFAPNDMTTLDHLACPTRMVFDRSRGGRVDAPVLPRHPKSAGRAETVNELLEMPDLQALRGLARPVSASLTDPRGWHWKKLEEAGPWPADDPWYDLLREGLYGLRVAEGDGFPKDVLHNVVLQRFGGRALDGKERSAVVAGIRERVNDGSRYGSYAVRPEIALVVERSMTERDSSVDYEIRIKEASVRGRSPSYTALMVLTWWLHMMALADRAKLVGRGLEVGQTASPRMRIASDCDSPDVQQIVLELRPRLRAMGRRNAETAPGRRQARTRGMAEMA
jgi:DNA-binding MarR family transcriptional regulator